jgi:hypothetical protein
MNPSPDNSALQRPAAVKDLSHPGQCAAMWFRLLARGVKTARLYRGDNTVIEEVRQQVWDSLSRHLLEFGSWRFRFTTIEIFLDDETVVRPPARRPGEDSSLPTPEEQLPFTFYRDGIRAMTLAKHIPKRETDALFEALRAVGTHGLDDDDLLTLLWQANLTHVLFQAVPLEQTIYLSSVRTGRGGGPGTRGQSYVLDPSGSEIRAELGQITGAQGLHRDTFDDWSLPDMHVHAPAAYQKILPQTDAARARLLEAWESERTGDWTEQVPVLMRQAIALDDSDETRFALCHSLVTWSATALQQAAWQESSRALELLREVDPDGSHARHDIAATFKNLDLTEAVERLDEAEGDDVTRFAALAVGIGQPAIPLAISALTVCTRSRVRAAACTALTYLCGDEPRLLEPFLADPRWYVVRNIVFVLGQIGGSGVVDMLRIAANHPDSRVRREVVRSLGSVSRPERTPVLIAQLNTRDPQLLASALALLTRERTPRVAKAILDRVEEPDFDYITEDLQRPFLNALAEVVSDDMVPGLERVLQRGGWFAQKTLARSAAARMLKRIGTERSLAALDAGLRSRIEPVRLACIEAASQKEAA